MTNANCIDTNLPVNAPQPAAPWRDRIGNVVGLAKRTAVAALDTLAEWQERARQRRQLQELDDHMLRDLGLSRADAQRESERPFWDI